MRIPRLYNVSFTLLALLIINLRPAIIGQIATMPILALIVVSLLFIAYVYRPCLTRSQQALVLLNGLMGLYLFVHTLTGRTSTGMTMGINTVIVLLVGTMGCSMFGAWNSQRILQRTIVWFVASFAISQLVTVVIIASGAGSLDQLLITQFSAKMYEEKYCLLFPFTIMFRADPCTLFGVTIPRVTGFMREPGLYQVMLMTTFFIIPFLQIRGKRLLRAIMLLATVTTFSTTAFVVIISGLIFEVISSRRMTLRQFGLSVCGLSLVAVLGIWFHDVPQYGLSAKLTNQSWIDRREDMSVALDMFSRNPLCGAGFTEQGDLQNPNLNLVVALGKVGVIGVLLHLATLFYAASTHYDRRTLVVMFPMFLTSLTTQPIWYTTLPVLIMFFNMRSLARPERQQRAQHQLLGHPMSDRQLVASLD